MSEHDVLIAPGANVGNYRIERLLGRGGMGEVYLAQDQTLRRPVALKVIHRRADVDSSVRNTLLHEARSAAALNHPNICTIYEVGESEGRAFIAMEYVEGSTLYERLMRGPLTIEQTFEHSLQAADALAEAHQRGVVHRDFKSANAIVTPSGRLKVVDFGLAGRSATAVSGGTTMSTLAQHGSIMGTPYAMAPEQVRGALTDARTDVWALGVLLYEMVSGNKPFDAASAPEMYSAILRDPPAPLPKNIPADLRTIITRCLTKEPEARFRDAGEVREALATARARPSAAMGRFALRSWHGSVALVAVAAAVLLMTLAWPRWRSGAPNPLTGPVTIAILPLNHAAGDSDLDALSHGLSQDMISVLSGLRSERITVVSRAVSMGYDATGKSLDQIGQDLKANAVLRGSFGRSDNRVRITAELLQTENGGLLWSQTYDRGVTDLFPVGREIIAAVIKALGSTSPDGTRSSVTAQQVKPEAYDLYLRGLSHAFRVNEPDQRQAIALFERALALEPSFVTAYGYLASAYGHLASNYRPNEPEWEEKGFAAAQRALALDPNAAEAHYARAVMLWRPSHGFASREALTELRIAVAAQPNFDEAWHQLGVILFHIGHLDSGEVAIRKAVDLNPANTLARFRLGPIYVYQQKFDEALAALDRVPRDTYPAQWTFQKTWSLISLGRLEEATRVVEEALHGNPVDQGGVLHSARAMLRAKRGDKSGSLADVAEAIRIGKGFVHFHHTAYSIGAIYTALGDFDRAQEWIERAALDGFPNYTYFENDLHLASLRTVPRFRSFLERLRKEWEDIPGESR